MRGLRLHLSAFLVGLCAFGAEKVEILRDDYGIPHIYARTPAGAAYASGYAQAADRGAQLTKNLRSSKHAAVAAALSPSVLTIVKAYCAGINAYLVENGLGENGQGAEPIDPSMVEAFSRIAFGLFQDSNDIFISPSRSRGKSVIAIIAPYGDWTGASRLYPLVVEVSGQGGAGQTQWSFAGAGPVGIPFPLLGHSGSIAIAARGGGQAGERALDQAWAMVTSRSVEEAKRALDLGQFPAQKFLIADQGTIYDTGAKTANPPNGILMSGGGAPQAVEMTRHLIADAATFSLESAESLALATDVYKAETWQSRIAEVAPGSEFARLITGWSRRAEANSRGALAFYLFKMALHNDSIALEPPDSISDDRVRAALRNAQDRLETEFPVDAGWGTLFRIFRDGAQRSWPMAGGTVTQAGMATPRAISFERPGTLMLGRGGLAMLEAVEFSKPVRSAIMTPFGQSDSPQSPHFDDQARDLFSQSRAANTWFEDRKHLEKHSKDRQDLVYLETDR